MAADSRDIAEIDTFISAPKTLSGNHPAWAASIRQGEWAATWGLLDDLGVPRGSLRFKCLSGGRNPTVNLLLRKMLIARLDVVSSDVCENQPLWAAKLGLPPRVCGSHLHSWEANRAWVADVGINEGIPAKEPLPDIGLLSQAVSFLCYRYNIAIAPGQEGFEAKSDDSLFGQWQ